MLGVICRDCLTDLVHTSNYLNNYRHFNAMYNVERNIIIKIIIIIISPDVIVVSVIVLSLLFLWAETYTTFFEYIHSFS